MRASLLNLHKQSLKLLNDWIFPHILLFIYLVSFVFELLSTPSYRHLLIWIVLWLEIWTMQAAYTKLQNYLCVWEHRGDGRLPKRYKNSQIVKEHNVFIIASCSDGWSVSGTLSVLCWILNTPISTKCKQTLKIHMLEN